MKKKTLLSLLTGVAIIASTAGTYAAWDKISDNGTTNVTFRKPVTVNYEGSEIKVANTDELKDGTPSMAVNGVQFTVSNPDGKADTLTITPNITLASDTKNSLNNDFTISIQKKDEENVKSDSNGVLTDSVAKTTSQEGGTDQPVTSTYNVTITPKSDEDGQIEQAIAGQKLNVTLTAQLSKAESGSSTESTTDH